MVIEIWALEECSHGLKSHHSNAYRHSTKDHILCRVCYDENQQTLCFSDYNKNITHAQINKGKIIPLKHCLMHREAQQKRQNSVWQIRRHTGIAFFTVNVEAISNR